MEFYAPSRFVDQADLEKFDNAGTGKYTIGLGQNKMSFCSSSEDINSICLSATHNLLDKYNLNPRDIGRLEVGTETLIDKSKSVKTVLMKLFEQSGNTSLEGLDTMNACFGGTNAVMNAVNWVHSPDWDGRYAVVVAGDIAIYERGPARPSGGAGAVAMLIGRKAPIVVETGLKAFHMEHAYDFYKPDLNSEYPSVDGKLSIDCYLRAFDRCYDGFAQRYKVKIGTDFSTDKFAHMVYHAPYNKLVRKGFARAFYNDYRAGVFPRSRRTPTLDAAAAPNREATYQDREVEKAFMAVSEPLYDEMIAPGTVGPANVGNTYTASVYLGLASLISERPGIRTGERIGIYSYGSGLAASLFCLRIDAPVRDLAQNIDLTRTLAKRTKATPEEFTQALADREAFKGKRNCKPSEGAESVAKGAYYLTSVDSEFRREYARKE